MNKPLKTAYLLRKAFMKRLFTALLILLMMTGCGNGNKEESKPDDVPEEEMVQENSFFKIDVKMLSETYDMVGKVTVSKAKYEVLENGSYKFYLTLKGPKGYHFQASSSGVNDYLSEQYDLDGNVQEISFIVSRKKLQKMDELIGCVSISDDSRTFFKILDCRTMFETELEDPNDSTYDFIDITEDGEADYGTLEKTTIKLLNYSYYEISDEEVRLSVTFASASNMKIELYNGDNQKLGVFGTTKDEETTIRFTIRKTYLEHGLQLRISKDDKTGMIDLKTDKFK